MKHTMRRQLAIGLFIAFLGLGTTALVLTTPAPVCAATGGQSFCALGCLQIFTSQLDTCERVDWPDICIADAKERFQQCLEDCTK